MPKDRAAVVFTCFNRKEKTICCLKSLEKQKDVEFDYYICDDGSDDGTVQAIKEIVPNAHIVLGTGNLFWTKGMYVAMQEAVNHGYEYYLMVNDDVEFKENMWFRMSEPFKEGYKSVAVVGYMTTKEATGQITYGGRNMRKSLTNYCIGELVPIDRNGFASCDVANWNCFLLDSNVINRVGLLDPYYAHALGDYDYCLRMRKNDLKILVAKEVVGYCAQNSRCNTYLDSKLPRSKRIELIRKPNGFPAKSWIHFCNKHCGIYRFRCSIMPLVKDYLAILFGKDI